MFSSKQYARDACQALMSTDAACEPVGACDAPSFQLCCVSRRRKLPTNITLT